MERVISYTILPALPAGLTLNPSTGVISGAPTVVAATNTYTVTATNSGGSTSVGLSITVNDAAPGALTYSTNPATYTRGTAIPNNTPTSGGGVVISYSVLPALPAGLSLDPSTGVISGTPTVVAATNTYTVTATNSGGSTSVGLSITVNDIAPTGLTYSTNPATYARGTAIPNNTPTIGGGAVISYAVLPALPAGLALNSTTGVISGTPSVAVATNTYTVTATNTGGSTSVGVSITVNEPSPTVSAISPSSGPTLGGTAVTITGTDLTGATAVTIAGNAATSVVVVNSTTITAVTPAGVAGTASVLVTTAGGTNAPNTLFTYVTPSPTVTSISPTNGTALGGTAVTITGSNFTGATAVTVGGNAATSVVVVNATTITAVTPAHAAGVVDVAVTTGVGTGTGAGLYTYLTAATTTGIISSVNPSQMGQTVTFTATITPTAATGTITFTDGTTVLCNAVAVVSGVATCSASFTTPGTHAITAAYSGSGTYSASNAALTLAVHDTRAKTVEAIGTFLGARNNQILSNGPDESRQINRLIEAGGGAASTTGSGFATSSSAASEMPSRLGAGPDAADFSQMRLGRRDTPLFDSIGWLVGLGHPADPSNGGGSAQMNGIRLNGNVEGAMRFGFATSLRDISRAAADAEAQKLSEAGLAFSGGLGLMRSSRPNSFDVWVEGKYASFSDSRSRNDLDGHFGLISIGADYVLSPSLLLGTMVQFDSMQQRSSTKVSEVKGQGWLAGPYMTLRLSENVFWQARGAWGQSSNEVSPFLTYTDTFDSQRWLVSTTLSGRWSNGAWSFSPTASVSYMEDMSRSYADTYGNLIPSVKSSLGQAKVGPEVGYRFDLGRTVIEPHAGVQVIYNFAQETTAAGFGVIGDDVTGPQGARGRAEVGFRALTSSGIGVDVSGSYDGIGAAGYSAMTGRAMVRVPLN